MEAVGSRLWTVSLLIAAVCCQSPQAYAGRLQKVWEVDFRKLLHVTNGIPEFPVFALRFSPDGRKLAVIADIYNTRDGRRSRLLVSDIDHPPSRFKEFEIEFGILENGRGAALNFGWAPSGEIVYALGKVVHLADSTTCELPNQSVFISDDVAISARAEQPAGATTHIKFYSEKCEERGMWDVPEGWLITDVSTDRGLLSVQRDINSAVLGERLIVDPLTRRVLQRWPENGGGGWEFADSGKAVCRGGAVLQRDHAPAICRNVDTGEEIGETKTNGVEPMEAAARARRIVVSDYRRRKIPFSYEYDATFHGQVVWDFGTGQELVSWNPASASFPNGAATTPSPLEFTISPNGQYIAEGGNGIIRLYKIEP